MAWRTLAFRERRLVKIRDAVVPSSQPWRSRLSNCRRSKLVSPRPVPDDTVLRDLFTRYRVVGHLRAWGHRDLRKLACQAVTSSAHQVIVALTTNRLRISRKQAAALGTKATMVCNAPVQSAGEVSADDWPSLGKGSLELYALGVDPFVAPEQTRHGRVRATRASRSHTRHLSPRDRMRRKVQTRRGRQRSTLCGQSGVRDLPCSKVSARGFRGSVLPGHGEGERRIGREGERASRCLLKLVPGLPSVCTGKHGSMGQLQRIRNFAEVCPHGGFQLPWRPEGSTGKIRSRSIVADPQAPLR